jgi:hypothetical protein
MSVKLCDFFSVADQDETCSQNPEMVQVTQSRAAVSGSPRGHVRSYSDVTPTVVDELDSRQAQHTDKKTVKTILSHLLPTPAAMAPIQVGLHLTMLGIMVKVCISFAKRKCFTLLPQDTSETLLTVK